MMVTHELPPPATIHVGLDVAKLTLQVDLAGRDLALPNTPAGHRSLLTHLRRWQVKTGRPTHVVCEGTGGYERAVVRALQARVNPSACTTPPGCAPSPVPKAAWPRPTRSMPPS